MKTGKLIYTLPLVSAERMVEAVEQGVEPLADPRKASRAAALEALHRLRGHLAENHELDSDVRIAGRLLAVIAAINGERLKH